MPRKTFETMLLLTAFKTFLFAFPFPFLFIAFILVSLTLFLSLLKISLASALPLPFNLLFNYQTSFPGASFQCQEESLISFRLKSVYPDYQTELCFCVALCAILPSACHKCHLLSVETAGNCVLGLKLPLHVRSEVVQSSDRWKTALSFLHTRMAFLKRKAQMLCFSKWCEQT